MVGRALAILSLAAAVMSNPATAADPVLLHAAGSLRTALTEVAGAFESATGPKVQAKYAASGTLKDEIASGARAEVFASANMAHPQALASAKKSGANAYRFAMYILSADGQRVLAKYGFTAPALPQ